MSSWESFANGWRLFWTRKSANFSVSLLCGLVMLVALVCSVISPPRGGLLPHYRTIAYTFPSTGLFPGFGPFLIPFIFYCLVNLVYVAVMSFAGLTVPTASPPIIPPLAAQGSIGA